MDFKMKNVDQQIIKFNYEQNFKDDDFYVSKSNQHLFDLINAWPKWEKNFLNISGEKYSLDDSIILLIFKDGERLRILSRININDNLILKNKSFNDVDIDDDGNLKKIINNLKTTYEDYWKNINQVNTSIRLTLNIKVKNKDNIKISNFETILNEKDLIYDFHISKFDKDFVYYQIIFNGTPNNFLKSMSHHDYTFDTQNKLWILK